MKFDTIAVQGAHKAGKNRHCISVPIYQTTAFDFDTVDYAADLFDLKCGGDIYTRISNPTTQVLEERLAMLEGGVGALAVSSGQAASLTAVLNLAKAGDEVVASSTLYGGTINLLCVTLKKFGIKTVFVDSNDIADYEKVITDKTVCIFSEALGNPDINVADIEALANVAHKYSIPLIVDNTVPSPYFLRPFEFGADIVVHSTTKYISGHGNAMGGAVVDAGNFDWAKSGKFPDLVNEDPSYHGLSYTKTFGKAAFIVKARTHLLRDLGTCMSPFNAYLTLIGLDTLHLRMQRHADSALKLATFLSSNPAVEWVNYPGLKTDKYYNLAQKYLKKGASSLLSFGIKGTREQGQKFIENLKLLIHATNIGDARTIVTYPALTTHRQLSSEQMKACGIDESFIRISVGLEDIDDIIDDVSQALIASQM
ncbi:MAG: O-acetylhomoserine aminocarboxypropyltransferase/cysteine synthase [Candidatus Gastranaerophilales bacterium]|nr:O-acetylhomoserine aminocarboxypropyltransferase/cysteine synthase [Candidatus Gastranaerophilales bacterium]